jgi:hypothetical protein
MKTLLLFCIGLLSAQASFSQGEGFYYKILNEMRSGRNGYFVALDVKSYAYNGRVIVTRSHLKNKP